MPNTTITDEVAITMLERLKAEQLLDTDGMLKRAAIFRAIEAIKNTVNINAYDPNKN